MQANNSKEQKSSHSETVSQITLLYEMLRNISNEKFYGSVEIKFEAGKVTIVKKTESIKI